MEAGLASDARRGDAKEPRSRGPSEMDQKPPHITVPRLSHLSAACADALPDGAMMEWHVQFSRRGETRVEIHPTPEAATEAACLLMDQGCDVYGIGTDTLTDTIGPDRIAAIYESWRRGKHPFGPRRA
jgi:hypothetical protein